MIPNRKNTTDGCNPTSSNCVVWQGPDLTCIDVCHGDSISDIVAKIAEKLCECCGLDPTSPAPASMPGRTGIDISTINQLCLESTYGKANDLNSLLQNIITETCLNGVDQTDPCSCLIPVPDCLREDATNYIDNGNSISSLVLYDPITNKGYAQFLAQIICDRISAVRQTELRVDTIEGRVKTLELRGDRPSYIPPTVLPQYVGSGVRTSIENMLALTEEAYGETRLALGTTSDINRAISYQQQNLAAKDKLNGNGVMSSQPGWIVSPANLAQSHQNLWLTTNDIRNAVESLHDRVAKPVCSDLKYQVEGTINRQGGVLQSIDFDFSGTEIPSDFHPKFSQGTRITISDASLNSKVFYARVKDIYQQSATAFSVVANTMGNLDTNSNYSVKVEFAFQSDNNDCAETQTFTINNETPCPVLTIGTLTDTTIPFSATASLPSDKGYVMTVNLKTRNGSLIDSRSTSNFTSGFTGTFSNLTGSTTYLVNVSLSQTGSTYEQTCPDQSVTTIAPVRTSVSLTSTSTNWDTVDTIVNSETDAGVYYDGSNKIKYTVGFNNSGDPTVNKISTADTTSAASLVSNGSFINPFNPKAPISCEGNPIAVDGTITANSVDSGWKYLTAITNTGGAKYYVFTEVKAATNEIIRVQFCTECDGLFIHSENLVEFCVAGQAIDIKVKAVGNTAGSTFTWSVVTAPSNGTALLQGSPTSSEAVFRYTNTSAISYDSFVVKLTNECGDSNVLRIPIFETFTLGRLDTDITVVVDTATFTVSEANLIKGSFNTLKAQIRSSCPNWRGTINYVAALSTGTSRPGDYLKHMKGMVENINGATKPTNPALQYSTSSSDTWYTSFMESGSTLPAYWTTSGSNFPSDVFVISFVNNVDKNGGSSNTGTYGSGALADGWGAGSEIQPTTSGAGVGTVAEYQEDYDAMIDMKSSAAPTGSWATDLITKSGQEWKSGSIPFTFSQIVVNKITGSTNTTAAAALQMASAITGPDDLDEQQFGGMFIGGPVYPVDLATYLKVGVSPVANPYNTGKTTPAGNALTGLRKNFNINAHMQMEQNASFSYDSTVYPTILTYFFGMIGMKASSSTNCPVQDSAYPIGGSNAKWTAASKASDACRTASSSGILIYSAGATGSNSPEATPFQDNAVLSARAYTTPSAATNGQSEYELTNGNYYAIYRASGTQYVAKYNTTAVGGKYWTDVTTC